MLKIVNAIQENFFLTKNRKFVRSSDSISNSFFSQFIYILIFVIAGVGCQLFAQRNIDKSIKKGLELSYQFKWEEAESIFTELIAKNPELPAPYHYYSGIFLWYFLSSSDEADLVNFTKYSDLAIENAKKLLVENPENTNLLYILGANYNYRAIAFAQAENYLDAIWASKKSESFLREVLLQAPDHADACLGLGLYSFSISQVPAAFSWALNLAGIKGSIEEGLSYIRRAASDGEYSKVEAQYYLSQILSGVVFDFDEASQHLTKLSKKYPSNLVFNYSLAVVDIKNKKLASAEKTLLNIVKSDQTKFRKVIAFSNFLLGDVHFKQNDFVKAVNFYQTFLKQTPDRDYTGIASYRLAISYELVGDRIKAEDHFGKCGMGNMDLEDDVFVKRKGNIYLKRTISEAESNLIRFANMIENAKYKSAFDSLNNLLAKVKTEKLKAEILYYMSEAAFFLGNYTESAELAENSFSSNQNDEKWVKPFAYYNAARAYHELKDYLKRDKFIELAEENNEYDYQNMLKNHLYVLKRKSIGL